MVGFIKGIFSKSKSETAAAPPSEVAPVSGRQAERRLREQSAQKALAYFLDADAAQSMGNIDYMRTARSVRRTFPKTVGQLEAQESMISVSALKMATANGKLSVTEAATGTQPAAPKVDAAAERRRMDPSLNRFRTMAREIKQ